VKAVATRSKTGTPKVSLAKRSAAEQPSQIAWTPALRKLILPERGVASSPADWEKLDLRFFEDSVRRGHAKLMKGLDASPPEVRPLLEHERWFAPFEDPKAPLDLEIEAVRRHVSGYRCARWWIEREGPRFALEAMTRSLDWSDEELRGDAGTRIVRNTEYIDQVADLSNDPSALTEIRRSFASEAESANTPSVLTELWSSTTTAGRIAMAYAFPSQSQWAAQAAEEALAARAKTKRGFTYPMDVKLLLASLRDEALAVRLARLDARFVKEETLVTLLHRLEERAAPVTAACVQWALEHGDRDARKRFARSHLLIETEEAFGLAVPWLEVKLLAPIVLKAFNRRPELAAQVRAKTGDLKGHVAKVAAIAFASSKSETAPLAKAQPLSAHVPAVLRSPPWTEQRPAPPTVEGLTVLPYETRLVWQPGELERLQATLNKWEATRTDKDAIANARTDAELVAWIRRSGHGMPVSWVPHISDTSMATELWETQPARFWWRQAEHGIVEMLARHGLAILPGLFRFGESRPAEALAGLLRVVSPQVALFMADLFLRLKTVRPMAESWLLAYPDVAAIGLVPLAVGRLGKDREAAAHALRHLAAHGHGETINEIAQRYGRATVDALGVVMAVDPLHLFPAKLPKLPDFFHPSILPAIELTSGGTLPPEATVPLAVMLAFSRLDAPYAGIAEVKAACTAESLRAWSWALFESWLTLGGPAKEYWAFHQLGWFGDDETVRRLVPLIRAWPGQQAPARAVEGLKVLGTLGGELALMMLNTIADKAKFASIKETATEMMNQIAEQRGLSRADLADRLVPDLGLDARGTLTLDFGPRQFMVGFDEALTPTIRDASGKTLRDLPKPGKTDDAAAAKRAIEQWKALKKDVKAIARSRIVRLEMAMIARRRWPASDWKQLFAGKPLVLQLARRLVWGVYDSAGKLTDLFRVAEDGSLADGTDSLYEVPNEARIGLVHPAELTQKTLQAWATLFSNYEVLQPFPQLSREVFTLTTEQANENELKRVNGLELPAPKVVFGLESLGWKRWGAEDGGSFNGHSKEFPETPYSAQLTYEGEVAMGHIEEKAILTLGSATILRDHEPCSLSEVDAIIISEVLRDLTILSTNY
jgi:hypothetical protein